MRGWQQTPHNGFRRTSKPSLTDLPGVMGVNPELSPAWLRSLGKDEKRVAAAEGARDKRTLTEYTVVVRWESGLPVRLARKGTPVPEYAAAHYVLSVSRMPIAFMAAMVGGAQAKDRLALAQQMLQSSSLQWGGKDSIPADHAEWTESDFEPPNHDLFSPGSPTS